MWAKSLFGTGGILYMKNQDKRELIHDALNYLDDEMIEEVAKLRDGIEKEETPIKKISWRKWTAMAAGVCAFALCGWMVSSGLFVPIDSNDKVENNDTVVENIREETGEDISDGIEDVNDLVDEEESALGTVESLRGGVVIPQMEVNLENTDDTLSADMLGFFILNGRSYIQYEFQTDYDEKNADFVGDYVGHITGTIDEWTEADGYVEGAGTYTGDVYEVKGISPDFMLCMVRDDGVETFINHNGITLYSGSNLVDDWLDLRGNYKAIAFETIKNQQWRYDALELTEEEMLVFDRFLDAFAEGGFVYVASKLEYPFGGDLDTADMMDFYFIKENGVRLRFRTLGDGYVCFPWLNACIQIDQELYDEVVEILMNHSK